MSNNDAASVKNGAIYSITKFTALDYPGNLAAIFWFAGCPLRCLYCYNADIVLGVGKISEDGALEFLKTRVGLLDGVVLSGGEATAYLQLDSFCEKIKKMGFKIKLDTSGVNPIMVEKLLTNGLIDFIALDFKGLQGSFEKITQKDLFKNFEKSLEIILKSDIDFEVRTTIHSGLLDENEINKMVDYLSKKGYQKTYYLQNYLHAESNLGGIGDQKAKIDLKKLSSSINIEFRN